MTKIMNKIEEDCRNDVCTSFDYFKTDSRVDVVIAVETSRDRRKAPLSSWFQMDMDTVAFVIFLACNHAKHTFVKNVFFVPKQNILFCGL